MWLVRRAAWHDFGIVLAGDAAGKNGVGQRCFVVKVLITAIRVPLTVRTIHFDKELLTTGSASYRLRRGAAHHIDAMTRKLKFHEQKLLKKCVKNHGKHCPRLGHANIL